MNVDVDLIEIILGVLVVLLSLQQYIFARSSSYKDELSVLVELKSEWMQLKGKWRTALSAVLSVDSFYNPLKEEDRRKLERIKTLREDERSNSREIRSISHDFEQSIREVMSFFDSLSIAVFSGKISPASAYSIVGAELPRRSNSIRVMLAEKRSTTNSLVEITGFPFPGVRGRVLALLDVLWAEAARVSDLYSHELIRAAEVKNKSKTGRSSRRRVRSLVFIMTPRVFWKFKVALKLDRHLLHSQFLGEFGNKDPMLVSCPRNIKRKGIKGKLLRVREFICGYIG